MDANLIICIIMIVICVSIFILGCWIVDKWDQKVETWKDNYKHREEFMECLIMGWGGWMLPRLVQFRFLFLFLELFVLFYNKRAMG